MICRARHPSPGRAVPRPDGLDGRVHAPRMLRILKVFETKQIGQSPGIFPITPCQGAIRHYMISRIFLGRLHMTDKGGDFNGSMQHFT